MHHKLRPIEAADDPAVARIIRTVMPEFGANGPGFAINDPEVDGMSLAYAAPRHAYLVVVDDAGTVVGGAGYAPLTGGDAGTCELRKMYFLSTARGHGTGERLLRQLLDGARSAGFRHCYLETLRGMDAAMRLYARCGFQPLSAPLGATGHFSCDRYYLREL
ncbi:MAG: GNAT family N-acetyltransferase [Gammaproteobacteria bacterium]